MHLLDGGAQSLRIVQPQHHCLTDGAESAARHGMIGIPFDLRWMAFVAFHEQAHRRVSQGHQGGVRVGGSPRPWRVRFP